MVMRKRPGEPRLAAADWIAAALDTMARGGLGAVAVEPLAARLGVSKGSFYWHFRDRRALVRAALARWERAETGEVIAALEAVPEPRARLAEVLARGLAGELGGAIDAALLADAADPDVAPVLERVTRARLAYTTRLYRSLGLDRREAAERALLAYAAYVGHFALGRAAPGVLPRGARARSYAAHVVATLVPRAPTRR